MYPLGEHFKLRVDPITNDSNIVKGDKYRISVLTSNLVRLEYSETGSFLDEPTQLIWNRNFGLTKFDKKEDPNFLEITTPYMKITYAKNKSFVGSKMVPNTNLKVQILGTDVEWYYGKQEVRNLGTSGISLNSYENKNGKEKGLYSLDGYTAIDDSFSKVLQEDGTFDDRKEKEIDVYLLVYRNDFMLGLKNYFALTSYPCLIPRYALGNWWSKTKAYSEKDVKELIEQFSKKRIPLSVFLFDKDWHNENAGFTFNPSLYNNTQALIQFFRRHGIEVGLGINPTAGFLPGDSIYQESVKYLQTDKNGIIPFDVLNPRWIDVYLKMYIHPLDTIGISFYWLKDSSISKNEKFLLKHYQIYDALRNSENRPFVLAPFSGIGDHRYSALYSGPQKVSWDTLSAIPHHNFSATNLGISWWAHDIGGYYKGIEESELYIRFVQLGVFSPILKFGTDASKYYKREPWNWDVKTYSIVREYLNMRHQLVPYLYSLAYLYHKQGNPLIRPLYYEYETIMDDIRYRNEYYLGKEFLICPIISKKDPTMERTIHRMFIPAGTWYDFVTGKKFPGNKEYISFFKEQDYPVFARAGAIIPMGYNDNINDLTPPKNMEIHIFPGCSNSFKLYEDDGKTNMYLKGYYLLTDIEYKYEQTGYSLTLKALEGRAGVVPDTRNYKFRFRNTKECDQISISQNGELSKFTSYVDGNDFIIEVSDVKTTGQLQIRCLGENFEIEATRIINNDIDDILNDLQIETEVKDKLASILFSDWPIKKKRIEVRKVKGLDKKFVKLFLKLLEYIEQV